MTTTDPAGQAEPEDTEARTPPSGPALSANTFIGPTALQVGTGNTMNVSYRITRPLPLDAAADELAAAVGLRWEKEAGLRRLLEPAPLPVRWQVSDRKLAGRIGAGTAEGARARFPPLPGLAAATREDLRRGGGLRELHALYGGLASGRLLLVGPPAAGKTAAAVLLLLDALRYRANAAPESRSRIPVPVMLSPHGWDPGADSPADWAAERLAREYTLFRGRDGRARALELLGSGRIALFIDGLDEVAGRLRGAMVSALETADFRLVLVSRAKEAVLTARRARLGGGVAVALQPVRPDDAAAYLLGPLPRTPPPAWRHLTRELLEQPGGVVARALSGPLAIALLRDVYDDTGPVDELLDTGRFPTPRAIEDHLLDHAVAAAYTARPGRPRPRHSPETAERALRHIAARLTEQGTRDLSWWHIPSWTDHRPRAAALGTIVGVLYAALGIAVLWQLTDPLWAVMYGTACGIAGGVVAGRAGARPDGTQPLPSAGWRDIFNPSTVRIGIHHWFWTGTVVWLVFWPRDEPIPLWLCYLSTVPVGFSATLVCGRGYELVAGTFIGVGSGSWFDNVREHHSSPPVADTRSIGPWDVWLHHVRLRMLLGLIVGVAAALLVGPIAVWVHGFPGGLASGLLAGVWTALLAGPVGNLGVATALTAVQLAAREGTPVRLMSFLEDARRRNLLRTTGPVYQFRHARLQERLSRPAQDPEPEPGTRPVRPPPDA
ncbi:hypothetical protein OHS59_42590 [Streptomyces sp. NBC_00414]|uniref:hypothetical protein n=1 Tax=Streptomyces sp. NBC_00414 TaxID=2975739 RepID=UPI002E1D2CCC